MIDAENGCAPLNDFMRMVNDLTLRLEVQIIYSFIYFAIFVVGIIGNGLLIGTMVIRKRITVANVFLINLAVSDLLLCITALPITPVLAFVKRWMFGAAMCKLVPLCQGISVLISSYCLCLIAVDRYRSIVTPQLIPWTVREAQFFMVVCWAGAVAISSPLFITQRLRQIAIGNLTICGEFCGEYAWTDTRVKIGYGAALRQEASGHVHADSDGGHVHVGVDAVDHCQYFAGYSAGVFGKADVLQTPERPCHRHDFHRLQSLSVLLDEQTASTSFERRHVLADQRSPAASDGVAGEVCAESVHGHPVPEKPRTAPPPKEFEPLQAWNVGRPDLHEPRTCAPGNARQLLPAGAVDAALHIGQISLKCRVPGSEFTLSKPKTLILNMTYLAKSTNEDF
uniref:G-protein coupled receptors family 1 profile domain-containing protein n=1 Tax=Panagrolaimus sp. JU765 TaxID=591449 RepID=A0AC34Q4X9_9BILA